MSGAPCEFVKILALPIGSAAPGPGVSRAGVAQPNPPVHWNVRDPDNYWRTQRCCTRVAGAICDGGRARFHPRSCQSYCRAHPPHETHVVDVLRQGGLSPSDSPTGVVYRFMVTCVLVGTRILHPAVPILRRLQRATGVIIIEQGELYPLRTILLNGEWLSQHFCPF